MSRYDLILFDLDGTLTDPKPGITRAVRYALNQQGIVVDDLDALTPFIGPPLIESFMRFYGMDQTQAERALADYRAYFVPTGMFENAVLPGIPELLAELRGAGKRLYVATAKPAVYAERILAHFELARFFRAICGANLDETHSAKAEIIGDILAAERETPRERAVMIGDREHDILGARANDIPSIAVTYGYGSLAELRAAQPTHLAHSVASLRMLLLDNRA